MKNKNKFYYQKKTDLIQIISIVGSNLVIMLTFFAIAVSLHISSREDIRAISTEMKDFHEKLIRLEEKK